MPTPRQPCDFQYLSSVTTEQWSEVRDIVNAHQMLAGSDRPFEKARATASVDATMTQRYARAASAAVSDRAFRVARGEPVGPKPAPDAGWDRAFAKVRASTTPPSSVNAPGAKSAASGSVSGWDSAFQKAGAVRRK